MEKKKEMNFHQVVEIERIHSIKAVENASKVDEMISL